MKISDLAFAQTWLPWRIPGTTLWAPGSAILPVGGPITSWADRSHRAHNLGVNAAPAYVASAVNSRPGLRTNGSTTTMRRTPIFQVSRSYTLAMVSKLTGTVGVQGMVTNGGTAAGDGYGFITNGGNMFIIHDGLGFSTSAGAASTNAELWIATYDLATTHLNIYKNGVQVVNQAAFAGPIIPTGQFDVGVNGAFFCDFTCAEVYMADNAINAVNLGRLTRYLRTKYNL